MIIGNLWSVPSTVRHWGPTERQQNTEFRFNGMYETAESYRDNVTSTRTFLAPTIGWEIRSSDNLAGSKRNTCSSRAPIDRGLVALGGGVAPIPIGRFLGDPTSKNGNTEWESHADLVARVQRHVHVAERF